SASAGDVDGDGVPDPIVGESEASVVSGSFVFPGIAVFSGATGTTLYETTDGAGWCVRYLGDVDGDGFGDYLGTAIANAPVCATVGGVLSCGFGRVFSGADGSTIYTLRRQGSAAFGWYAALAGDLDGDDFPEVVISDPPFATAGRLTMMSLAPIGVQSYGTGCQGPASQVPRIGVRGSPTVGAVTNVHVSKATPGVCALLLLGASNVNWGPLPLPYDLGGLGVPGCSLLTSVDFFFPALTQATLPAPGRATVAFAIPSDPALVGIQAFVQWYVPSATGYVPGSMTRGVRLTIS
ncbi:MAG TPA: hypothetical protein VKF62_02390, partial [Planctomycetota bacterium]|nr:hypothetical protein [Planctomycetota bacterium]